MASETTLTRVFSDVHYGDRASLVTDLVQLQPLAEGASALVCNGDMLDSRIGGPNPAHTAVCRDQVMTLARTIGVPIRFLTGNHDPNLWPEHWMEFNGGAVLAYHGDVLFEAMVPWGRDGRTIRRQVRAALAQHHAAHNREPTFGERMQIWRAIACRVPQRHQSERRIWKYLVNFAIDTIWPPNRIFEILRAWRTEPHLAAAMARVHHPKAKFILLGHTHRPEIRAVPGGPIVINTGSFCAPFGGYCIDVSPRQLVVRRIERRRRAFYPGDPVAEFRLPGPA